MRYAIVLTAVLALMPAAAYAQAPSSSAATPVCAAGDPVVWVNTSSHVYHLQGTKYYGNTKSGKYACRSAADASGSHQAKGEVPKAGAKPGPTATPKHHRWHSKPSPSPAPAAT